MKKHSLLILLSLFYNAIASGELYIGAKAGSTMISDNIKFNDTTSAGIVFGANIQKSGIALEGEYTTSLPSAAHRVNTNRLNIYTLALYGVYRSSGKFYVKGKAGLLSEYLTISGGRFNLEGYGGAISFGAGAGLRITDKTNLEFEYTLLEPDIDFMSLGITYEF